LKEDTNLSNGSGGNGMISSIIKRNPKQNPLVEEEKEMSFIDHLEELRWHVVRSVAAIFFFGLLAFYNKDLVFGKIILGPSKPDFWTYRMFCQLGKKMNSDALCIDKLNFIIQARELSEQFTMHLASSVVIGLILAFLTLSGKCGALLNPAYMLRT
jgi:sec-independent protein translocase protein TatC